VLPVKAIARGEIYEIVGEGRLLICRVVNRADITAEVGARCAQEMDAALGESLLEPSSPYQGLVFDVRGGPIAFGPKTRASLFAMLGRAERASRRVAALVSDSPTQHMQFSNLQREVAPTMMIVSRSEDEARAWATGRSIKPGPP